MTATAIAQYVLQPRTVQHSLAQKPRLGDVVMEWLDAFNIGQHTESFFVWVFLFQHLLAIAIGSFFLLYYVSAINLFWFGLILLFHIQVFHTFWYHRYCAHKAFRFRGKIVPFLMMWLNPLALKEEVYALPHWVHHTLPDTKNDPYGPHFGFWGSFLALERTFFFNREMNTKTFLTCQKMLSHLPTTWNDREAFQRSGSFEHPALYPLRFAIANGFWIALFLVAGRPDLLSAWYLAVAIVLIFLRDFSFRGHDPSTDREQKVDRTSFAVNHWFYGWIVSEWHDNHHRFSSSAKNGFEKYQLDLTFVLIVVLHRLRIVESYIDSTDAYVRLTSETPASQAT